MSNEQKAVQEVLLSMASLMEIGLMSFASPYMRCC